MSFSHDVKIELSQITELKECCVHAQAYAMALFGRCFATYDICIQSDYSEVAQCYCDFIRRACGVTPALTVSDAGKNLVEVERAEDRKAIFDIFGQAGSGGMRINRANISDDCCASAFVRGAFLVCGTVTAPNKDYHLEFAIPYLNICRDLIKLLEEYDFRPKMVVRKGVRVIYFKDSESIEDILTFMGAANSSLEIMGVKMYKDMRNNINRKTNFETANITRTVDAAMQQVEAIRKIERCRGLDSLPEQLRKVAIIRRDNPEMSLREIGETIDEPISRSGINHRLRRIVEIAQEINEEA